MRVKAIRCLMCYETIFSRALDDFKRCSCGNITIDGGLNNTKISFMHKEYYEYINLYVESSKKKLYQDWKNHQDNFGTVRT